MDPRKRMKQLAEEARAIADAAEKDGRTDLSTEEMGKIGEKFEEIQKLQKQIKRSDESAALLKQLGDLPDPAADPSVKDDGGKPKQQRRGAKTLGDLFVESDGYKAMLERYPGGIPDGVVPTMEPVNAGAMVKGRQVGEKTLLFVGDNVGALAADSTMAAVPPDFRGILPPDFGPLGIMNLISHGSTTSDRVDIVREVRADRDLNAATVPEATSLTDDDALKPESGFRFKPTHVSVETIAHWIPTTRKALADVSQTRTLINTFLERGIDEELERQIVNGDGTDEFLGIANDTGVTAVAFNSDPTVSIRKAKTALWALGVTPTAILLSPGDDEAFDLVQDGQQRYYGNGPYGNGPQTLWGLPRVVSSQVADGFAYVGDFSSAVLYDREATTIMTGTVDKDFIRNIIRVLAEMRAAFGIWKPYQIAKVDLTA